MSSSYSDCLHQSYLLASETSIAFTNAVLWEEIYSDVMHAFIVLRRETGQAVLDLDGALNRLQEIHSVYQDLYKDADLALREVLEQLLIYEVVGDRVLAVRSNMNEVYSNNRGLRAMRCGAPRYVINLHVGTLSTGVPA